MTGDVQDLGINVGQEDHVVKSGSHVTEKEDAGLVCKSVSKIYQFY